jgi:hypothetical protein
VSSYHSGKFVLIHGAWHGGFAWDGVAHELRSARFPECNIPDWRSLEHLKSKPRQFAAFSVRFVMENLTAAASDRCGIGPVRHATLGAKCVYSETRPWHIAPLAISRPRR